VNRDASTWVSPLVAILVLAFVVTQTLGALKAAGAFGWQPAAPRITVAPAYQSLDRAIDRSDGGFTLVDLRDPFAYGHPEGPAGGGAGDPPSPRRPKPALIVVPAMPVLTAIVWDADPRALVHWRDRDWTIRQGGLFDDFEVVSITRDQVTLRRGDESLVLRQRNPGE
jgi:hypothetical protein